LSPRVELLDRAIGKTETPRGESAGVSTSRWAFFGSLSGCALFFRLGIPVKRVPDVSTMCFVGLEMTPFTCTS